MKDYEFSSPGGEIASPGREVSLPLREAYRPVELAAAPAESAAVQEDARSGGRSEKARSKAKKPKRGLGRLQQAAAAVAVSAVTVTAAGGLPSLLPEREGYPYAPLTASQQAFLDETYQALLAGDMDAMEDLTGSVMSEQLFRQVVQPYNERINIEYEESLYDPFTPGAEAGYLQYDGEHAGVALDDGSGRPLMWMTFEEYGGVSTKVQGLQGNDSEYLRQIMVSRDADYVYTTYAKMDLLPSEETQGRSMTYRFREDKDGVETLCETRLLGEFDKLPYFYYSDEYTYVLAGGTVSFDYSDSGGGQAHGAARVSGGRTTDWDENVHIDITQSPRGFYSTVTLDLGDGREPQRFDIGEWYAPEPYVHQFTMNWFLPLEGPDFKPGPAPAVTGAIAVSGKAGENLTWALTDDGMVTVNGTGPTYNFRGVSAARPGWFTSAGIPVTRAVVKDGVTVIGEYFFAAENSALVSVSLPASLTRIGEGAFDGCEALTEIDFAGSEEAWIALGGPKLLPVGVTVRFGV